VPGAYKIAYLYIIEPRIKGDATLHEGHPQSDLPETAMSRTIKFAKAGGPEVLEFVEVQVPAPGPNEVRIKVKAIGINRAEAMWRVDDYIEPVKFPAGLGYEAAGTTLSARMWAASRLVTKSTSSRPSR
jgi:hypothetical protein